MKKKVPLKNLLIAFLATGAANTANASMAVQSTTEQAQAKGSLESDMILDLLEKGLIKVDPETGRLSLTEDFRQRLIDEGIFEETLASDTVDTTGGWPTT